MNVLGIIEWCLTITSFVALLSTIWIGAKRRKIFLILLIPMMAIHILFEGLRWQIGIVYLYILIELIFYVKAKNDKDIGAKQDKHPIVLWSFGFVLTVLLILTMRYNQMDVLDGKYQVGTFSFDVVDEERIENYGETVGEKRKIRLQIWYPSDYTEGLERAKWLYDGRDSAKGVPAYIGLPGFLMSYTAKFESNSYLGASLSQGKEEYPLIVISHGWYGFRNLHTDVAERLASEGYIVVAIEHTYGSLSTVFDDGSVHFADPETLPDAEEEEAFAEAAILLVETYSQDVKKTLDVIEEINQGKFRTIYDDQNKKIEMLENRINVDQIGLMGHSTGGGGVVKTAMTDERVDAVMGLDPWIEPIEENYLEQGLDVPSLFISSEQWKDRTNDDVLKYLSEQEATVTKMYQLNGTNHQDFTMMYMFEPIAKIIGFTGDLDEERSREIQQDFDLQFFDYNLLDAENELMSLDEKYDEIIQNEWK